MRLRGGRDFERFYRGHVGAVFGFHSYSVDRAAAEDLTATTFERALRSWDAFDSRRASERTWVLAIARNLLIDHFRAVGRRDESSADEHPHLLATLADRADPLAERLSADALVALLAPFGERDRTVLALRFAADLSTKEIGQLMELTTANVQQILSRSLRRLRTTLEEPVSDSAARGDAPDGERA